MPPSGGAAWTQWDVSDRAGLHCILQRNLVLRGRAADPAEDQP